MPSTPAPTSGPPPAGKPDGETGVDLTSPSPKGNPPDASPLLPHERDQSVDMTDGERHPEVEQAYRDVKRGLQDTDRGPPADEAYRKLKR